MFTGHGDSSKLTEDERKTWDDLRRLMETGHVVGLSSEQTDMAIEAIRVYGSLKAATGVFNSIRNVSILLLASLVAGWTFWDNFVAFLRSLLAAN